MAKEGCLDAIEEDSEVESKEKEAAIPFIRSIKEMKKDSASILEECCIEATRV